MKYKFTLLAILTFLVSESSASSSLLKQSFDDFKQASDSPPIGDDLPAMNCLIHAPQQYMGKYHFLEYTREDHSGLIQESFTFHYSRHSEIGDWSIGIGFNDEVGFKTDLRAKLFPTRIVGVLSSGDGFCTGPLSHVFSYRKGIMPYIGLELDHLNVPDARAPVLEAQVGAYLTYTIRRVMFRAYAFKGQSNGFVGETEGWGPSQGFGISVGIFTGYSYCILPRIIMKGVRL